MCQDARARGFPALPLPPLAVCAALLLSLACGSAAQVAAAPPQPQKVIMGNGTNPVVYAALMDFYHNLNGDAWRIKSFWNATGSPPNYCMFAGVQCNEGGEVTSL